MIPALKPTNLLLNHIVYVTLNFCTLFSPYSKAEPSIDNFGQNSINANAIGNVDILTTPRLINFATRAFVDTGDNVLIGGFVIQGNNPKTILIRTQGISLLNFAVPDVLADPTILLFSGETKLDHNDDWRSHFNADRIPAELLPFNDNEAAIVAVLDPGPYTTIVLGVGNSTGNALVEVYEIGEETNTQMENVATRGWVGKNDRVMIGGFVIQGPDNLDLVIRAKGPSLLDAGIDNALDDPQILLFSGATLVDQNNNWREHRFSNNIPESLKPLHDSESAIFTSLPSGPYTVIVSGVEDTEGVGLIEIFDIGPSIKAAALNDTGIIRSGNETGFGGKTDPDDCTAQFFDQQDCFHGRDFFLNDNSDGHAGFSFTKMDSDGNVLSADATKWSCVKDNVSGLIWENKTLDSGLHHRNNTYRWGGKGAVQFGTEFYNDWDELLDGSNAEKLCGFDDWRIPTMLELESILNYRHHQVISLDEAYFPNQFTLSHTWSNAAYAADPSLAWSVGFITQSRDHTKGSLRNDELYVRLVRHE